MILDVRSIIMVGAGGMIGAILRFMMVYGLYASAGQPIYMGTLIVNVVGSFLMGVIGEYAHHTNLSDIVKSFLIPGILGGFTTFSAFAFESLSLVTKEAYSAFIIYTLASVLLSCVAVAGGLSLTRWIFS